MDTAYHNWLAYCRGCTDRQLRNVYSDERDRLAFERDDEIRADSVQAVSACRVVAAERGIELGTVEVL